MDLTMKLLMNQLKNKSPEAYNELQQLMSSGRTPQEILNDFLSSGRFSQQQVEQAKNMINQNIKRF